MLETIVVGYIFLSTVIALFSINKRIGFGTVLTIGLLFTPLAGMIAVLKSDNHLKVSRHITRYQCPECKMEFTEPHNSCPHCIDNNLEINLMEIKQLQAS